jgi:hypothetical protein
MQTATALRVSMIVSMAFAATSADAGRVRVSQEMEGVGMVVRGFVETFDRSSMTAEQVYAYDSDAPECQFSYGGNAFLPEPNATVMAVVDTWEGRTLFVVHGSTGCFGDESVRGAAMMSFDLRFGDGMACLVEDDQDEADCGGDATITTDHVWLDNRTDGLVLGALDDRWQLDASFTEPPTGTSGVVVRSDGDGEVGGLSTDRTIRFDNVIEVGVDVQPGAEVGCLNIDGNGVVPVAILGAAGFDVGEINIDTLALAGMLVRVRGNGEHQCAIEHVNGDDHPDLACHFFDDPDAWTPGESKAAVWGEFWDTAPFYGEDLVCVVGSPS